MPLCLWGRGAQGWQRETCEAPQTKSAKLPRSAFFTQERKMKPPVSEPHHFHLPFNQRFLPAPPLGPLSSSCYFIFITGGGPRFSLLDLAIYKTN